MKDQKDSPHKQAKLSLLKDLRSMAMKMIHDGSGDEPGHMEKVMVAAKDKAGLEKGLDKAKQIIGGHDEAMEPASEEGDESPMEEAEEMGAEEAGHPDEESPEAIQAQIEALQAKLKSKSK
jgi:hypothetical protein